VRSNAAVRPLFSCAYSAVLYEPVLANTATRFRALRALTFERHQMPPIIVARAARIFVPLTGDV
jgi:hypothetical protein